MNHQTTDRAQLNSNTNPSSVDTSKVEEPNLKVDTLISSFYATAQALTSSQHSWEDTLRDCRSPIANQERVHQRMEMTEQYLLKALDLDRR
jgi:hypothetical protein